MLKVGRVSIDVEWVDPWLWKPFADCYFERDAYRQRYYGYAWYGGFGWLKAWVQIIVDNKAAVL